MSTEVNKAAAWTCVEIAARDLSSLPGQSQLRQVAVVARKGNKNVRHLPMEGAENDPKQDRINDMVASASTSGDGKGLFEYLQMRGIGGYTSCSDEFLIEASSWGDLLESLRSRGFPVSREL